MGWPLFQRFYVLQLGKNCFKGSKRFCNRVTVVSDVLGFAMGNSCFKGSILGFAIG